MGRSDIYVSLSLSVRHAKLMSYEYRVGCETFSSLLFSYFAPVSRLATAQAETQGTLPEVVASDFVKTQTVPIVVKTIERIQKVHRSLYGTNFTL